MRTISRILALAHAAARTLAKWYAGELAVPILFALALSSGLFLAKALALGSPSWALLGFLLGAVTYVAAEVGRRSFVADVANTRALSAARQASTEALRQAKRDAETPRTAIERHEAARSSLWAMRYEVATRPRGRDDQ